MSNTQSLTAGFIDLATFDELEKYLYGGADATTYFVALVKTSTWFTLIPTVLTKNMGQADWGQEWAASISRAGDYLVHTWLRGNVPSVSVAPQSNTNIRWCHNFAHNLIQEATVTFNDLIAARFDSYYLDFWAAFTVPASKRVGYDNMIGNTGSNTIAKPTLNAFTFNLPLPFFFTRDTGVALPTAALPYNEMRIQITMRNSSDLLVVYPPVGFPGGRPVQNGDLAAPVGPLTHVNIWAEYAIVSNDERKRMGCAPRDILIEQVQTAPRQTFKLGDSSAGTTDIRFSHAVKALFFAARNKTVELSNYVVGNLVVTGQPGSVAVNVDPVSNATLLYENTQRLAGLPADYYSLVEPWYKAPTIPDVTGYHMYSYSINVYDINPMGSTNFGKLTNVSLDLASSGVQFPADSNKATPPGPVNYVYESVICAVNHNVIRISGGALGFPVL